MSKFAIKDWVYLKDDINKYIGFIDKINEFPIYEIDKIERNCIRLNPINPRGLYGWSGWKAVNKEDIINILELNDVYNYITDKLKSRIELYENQRKMI